ncbi:MAG: hypothetical protein A4E29_01343 [Methanomassiliicoccales archaeon PtaB.Bin134]|nr:MAG: hypothetical protein A4E29_01343 [Methanomassiliicoccales archaeon PtaB.Bin134]
MDGLSWNGLAATGTDVMSRFSQVNVIRIIKGRSSQVLR